MRSGPVQPGTAQRNDQRSERPSFQRGHGHLRGSDRSHRSGRRAYTRVQIPTRSRQGQGFHVRPGRQYDDRGALTPGKPPLSVLKQVTKEAGAPLELTAFCVRGEPISHADAMQNPFAPVRIGDRWGPPWSTTWFHVRGRVPDAWQGRRVIAVFDLGYDGPTGFTCEALAWKDGKPWRGVDPNHRWLPIDGPEVDFYLEAAANVTTTLEGALPALSMVELRESPIAIFTLNQAELRLFEPAPATAKPDLGPHQVTATGHAHIDTAWLWPLRATR